MRVLFSFVGGRGHFHPLVPIARAAAAAGHTVAFTGQRSMLPAIQAAGFPGFATGPDLAGTERRPLLAPNPEREDHDLREGFARRAARERATDVLALCAEWRPDLVVCDEVDFGSVVAAERLGLPYATVLVIAAGSFVRTELVAEPLNELRAEHGLPPDPELTMLSRYLVLSPFPPSLRDPGFPLPATAHPLRPVAPDSTGNGTPPAWLANLDSGPTVYFTLGTIFNLESGDLFQRVLEGLRDLPVNVVATVGPHIDPAEFGPRTANVHLERYLPQAWVLPYADVVISHGGSGSLTGALVHGLPSVLIPLGADQPLNAARCAALGAARVLDAVTATPESVRATVSEVLADPGYRRAAELLRDEIAAQPGPEQAVPLLERLADQREPVLSGRA
jgi:UDP:flavonoid glycosyltransferase YjiC (YdhE family)